MEECSSFQKKRVNRVAIDLKGNKKISSSKCLSKLKKIPARNKSLTQHIFRNFALDNSFSNKSLNKRPSTSIMRIFHRALPSSTIQNDESFMIKQSVLHKTHTKTISQTCWNTKNPMFKLREKYSPGIFKESQKVIVKKIIKIPSVEFHE